MGMTTFICVTANSWPMQFLQIRVSNNLFHKNILLKRVWNSYYIFIFKIVFGLYIFIIEKKVTFSCHSLMKMKFDSRIPNLVFLQRLVNIYFLVNFILSTLVLLKMACMLTGMSCCLWRIWRGHIPRDDRNFAVIW